MSEPNWLDQEPLFLCSRCYEDCSWYADELRVLGNETWCRECYADVSAPKALWKDLPPFVPKYLRDLEDEVTKS